MSDGHNRREWLRHTGGLLLGGLLPDRVRAEAGQGNTHNAHNTCIVGHPVAARAGADVLAAGGNAVDAIVAAALVAGVAAVQQCGIGGYGGHLIIALPGGRKITAIDFNSTAPAAAREDMFPLDEKGQVKGRANTHGWLAAGVPGTLAGLQLALDRYGSRPFRQLVQPAIKYARDGFEVPKSLSAAIRATRPQLLKDPALATLLLEKGQPLPPGVVYRNPRLAELLQTLATRNSVWSFYQGDFARQIAGAFKKNGGLVTTEDLAGYQPREVEPLVLAWRDCMIWTAPLTAGGATVLEALHILKVLGYPKQPARAPATLHASLEALRLAWDDRLKFLGDPAKTAVPLGRLLSEAHARSLAAKVKTAVRERKPAPAETDGGKADGTIHLSAVDAGGMMVALTLTHGSFFGAQVAVPELGLILGHGMSRFEPRPKHPNAPGPGKRPLHNMCPTIVTHGNQPVLAVGGTGGRRIPNAIFTVLAQFVGRGASLEDAVAAPRLHTEGGRTATLDLSSSKEDREYLKKIGYKVATGPIAQVHAVARDPKTGACRSASR